MMNTDRALLERWITSKDAEAFDEIVSRHASLVYAVSRRLLRNDADAEDVAQSCFLKLARGDAPPRSSITGWLHAVATRGAIDLLRAGSRRREREQAFARERARERSSEPPLRELQEHVDECIACLPDELREVIVSHFLERKTHDAVAADLGVSRQTVGYRIRKGIEQLRVLLGKRGVSASGAALVTWLGSASVEAAPATLLASLGRLALAGATAVAAPHPPAGLLLFKAGGFIMGKKILISAAAAAILLLSAGWIAFRHAGAPPHRIASRHGAAGMPGPGGAAASSGAPAAIRSAPGPAPHADLPPGAPPGASSISGKVVDPEGRPVRGARVVAAGPRDRPDVLAETVTGDDGGFGLEPATRDALAVFGFKPDVGLGAATGDPGALEITLEPFSEGSGRFYDRDTGQGIAGLRVRIGSSSEGMPPDAALLHAEAARLFPELRDRWGAVITDPEGRYAFQGAGLHRYRFQFDPDSSEYVLPGFRRDDATPEILLEPGERRSGIDFALERGGSIAGRVLGPDGEGLAGARVEILSSYATPIQRRLPCAPDGAYRFIGLAPNATYAVSASHEGLEPGESPTIALPAAEAIEGVDIRLQRGHPVRGRFIDDLGQPVGGIDVYLSRASGSDRRGQVYGKTATGADGSFSFENVAAGKHFVWPDTSRHQVGEGFEFNMPADGGLPELEFVLRRKSSGFISGRVVDQTGEPVAGFPVNAMAGSKSVSTALSGKDGAFRLDGLGDASSYTITGYTGEYWSGRQLAVSTYATDVTLMVFQRGRVAGRVVEAGSRKPIGHFEVRAVFIRTEPDGGENRFHLKWAPFDSEAGEFLIERAEPVDCEIQARADGYVEGKSARFSIPAGGLADGIVIALDRGASVEGIVSDTETGEPVPGVLVRAHQHDTFFPWLLQEAKASYDAKGIWKLAMSGADGRFAIQGLAFGETIQLVAWKDGYGPAVRPGLAVGQGIGALRISLARAATLVVQASFRQRPGLRHVFIAHHRESKPWRTAYHASSETEAPGPVEISRLPPGAYRLAVCAVSQEGGSTSRRLLGEVRLELSPGERRELPLDVDGLAGRFASVTGRIAGDGDRGSARLHIVSSDDPEEPYAYGPTIPGPDGSFRFTGLPAGEYVIQAAREAGGPAAGARLPVRLQEREHIDVDLALE